MATEIQQFFRDHGISEVEAIIPDMAGIARGLSEAELENVAAYYAAATCK